MFGVPIPICFSAYITCSLKDGVYGNHGQRPDWHLKADKNRFNAITANKSVIMGRKAWEGFQYHDKDIYRHFIVVSKDFPPSLGHPMCCPQKTPKNALDHAIEHMTKSTTSILLEVMEDVFELERKDKKAKILNDDGVYEIVIAGGASIFKQFLPLINTVYMTTVIGEFEGNVKMEPGMWITSGANEESITTAPIRINKDKDNSHACMFTTTYIKSDKKGDIQ